MKREKLEELFRNNKPIQQFVGVSEIIQDEAPTTELDELTTQIQQALTNNVCAVIPPPGRFAYTAGNSLVMCGPALNIARVFLGESTIYISPVLVKLFGSLEEELHYHTAHVISVVCEGGGYLEVPDENGNGKIRLRATPGSWVVIPQGTLHLFNCDPDKEMLLFTLEFGSSPLTHQKNFYSLKE